MLALLLLGACAVEAPEPVESGPIVPLRFQVRGGFAYDPALEVARSYSGGLSSGAVAPWMTLNIEVQRDDGAIYECRVEFTGDAEVPRTRSEMTSEGFGTDTAGMSTEGSCRNWDAELWGQDPTATLGDAVFGFGLAPLHPRVGALLKRDIDAESWELHWEPYILGAEFHFGDQVLSGMAYGLVVDDAFVMQLEQTETPAFHEGMGQFLPIFAEDVQDPNAPPVGAYFVETVEWHSVDLLQELL